MVAVKFSKDLGVHIYGNPNEDKGSHNVFVGSISSSRNDETMSMA